MKYIVIIGLFAVLLFTSCHKNDSKPATTNTSGNNNTNPNMVSAYGILTVGNYTSEAGGQTLSSTSAWAYFSSQATQYTNPSTSIHVNAVYLNNDSLSYNSSVNYYTNSSIVNLTTETWSVNGTNGIPSFTYANTQVFPSFDAVVLPDTIKKSIGFSVSINNVSNITNASLIVFDGTGATTGNYVASLHSGNNSVSVAPTNLVNLVTGSSASFVAIVLENISVTTVSGKNFKFSHNVQYMKVVNIVP